MNRRNYKVRVLVAGIGLLNSMTAGWCAPAVPETVRETVPPVSAAASPAASMRSAALSSDTALQVKVSFESKRQALSALLSDLEKQTGITLTYSQDYPAPTLRVTAYVKDLPLASVMASLMRLYGVAWTKTGVNEYHMAHGDRNEVEHKLLQLGDLNTFKARRLLADIKSQPDWAEEILQHTDEMALRSPEGVALSVFPVELIAKLRQQKQNLASLRLIESQHKAMEASLEEYVLHVENPTQTTRTAKGTVGMPTRVLVRTAAGEPITVITLLGVPKMPWEEEKPKGQEAAKPKG